MVCIKRVINTLSIACLTVADAPVKENSPMDAHYIARFDDKIQGFIDFSTTSERTVKVHVNISGLPAEGGPFPYHVHVLPVPSNGDCYGTLGHLNPYNGSEAAEWPAAKEVGDLSGKHGPITDQSFQASYIEQYLSLNKDDLAYVGNRSVVIHFANDTRLVCANITSISNSSHASSTIPTANAAVLNGFSPGPAGAAAAALGLLI